MLRTAVLLALVAVACAVSPFPANPNQVFATSNRDRFVPLNGNILLIAAPAQGANFYSVVSSGAGAAANPAGPIRQYFGDAGRERFQNAQGAGIQPQSHLFLSQSNGFNEIVDPRFARVVEQRNTNNLIAVPTFDRIFQSVALNVGDIVFVDAGVTTTVLNGVNYVVANIRDVKGVFSTGIRISDYPSHIAGPTSGLSNF